MATGPAPPKDRVNDPLHSVDHEANRRIELLEKVLADKARQSHRDLFRYWQDKRGPRPYPARRDIDPLDIPRLLPSIFLVDIVDGDNGERDFHYRLVGTRIVEIEGEVTDRLLSDLVPREPRYQELWQQYNNAADGIASFRSEDMQWRDNEHIRYEVFLLPLSSDGKQLDMLLGMADKYRAPVTRPRSKPQSCR